MLNQYFSGTLVVVSWALWGLLVLLHINKPYLLPLKFRVFSFYIPAIITVVYGFNLDDFLGYLALFAFFLAGWDDFDRRKEMS